MRTLVSFVLISALAATPAFAGSYAAGSLILPTNAQLQDDCGAVSVYGLVYDILRANPWLLANKGKTITIHYAYSDTKTSPNRCVPTNLDTPPQTGTTWKTAAWNDGCDFRVEDLPAPGTKAPVVLVDNANATNRAKDTSVVTVNRSSSTDITPRTVVARSPTRRRRRRTCTRSATPAVRS